VALSSCKAGCRSSLSMPMVGICFERIKTGIQEACAIASG